MNHFTRRIAFAAMVLSAVALLCVTAARADGGGHGRGHGYDKRSGHGNDNRGHKKHGGEQSACAKTSQDMLKACQASAQADDATARAECDNRADETARQLCRKDACAALKDAQEGCKEQYAARQDVCKKLGPAPYDPVIVPTDFVATVDNPLFPLTPGTTLVYEGQTAAGLEHTEFAVTSNTKQILGVTCVEVHETTTVAGELVEDTLDWFAQDNAGNVWYFGENSKQIAGGLVVGVEGSWTAGVDGAKPGIVMEAQPAVGDVYRQEFSLGNAEDIAEVLSLTESVTVPAGSYANCLETKETSALEPSALEQKFYAAGVGNVLTVDVETGEQFPLISITQTP